MSSKGEGTKTVAENRKARHDYFIEEVFEAGIVLVGTEVKSVRQGKANLKDSYADIYDSEIWVKNMHISPYEKGNLIRIRCETESYSCIKTRLEGSLDMFLKKAIHLYLFPCI